MIHMRLKFHLQLLYLEYRDFERKAKQIINTYSPYRYRTSSTYIQCITLEYLYN